MNKKSVHQFLPTLTPYDAIGNEVLIIKKILKNLGYSSEIFAENIHHSLKNEANFFKTYKNKNEDIIIYHHSIGSSLCDNLKKFDSKILMIYHNITPPKLFENINPEIAKLLQLGIEQLITLKDIVSFSACDSEFNRQELEKIGYKKTDVLPILLDFSKYKKSSDTSKNNKNILYVGRFAPNKCIEDIIQSFCYYNLNIDSESNLFLLGQVSDHDKCYFEFLKKTVDKNKLKNIHFITDANNKSIINYYSKSNLFITMSNHEGFCVPLVESMHFKIPIIAKDSTAIPFTLGNGGILIHEETFEEIGELINLVINNDKTNISLIKEGSNQLEKIYSKTNEEFIINLLKKI